MLTRPYKPLPLLLIIFFLLFLWFIPTPENLTTPGWHLLSLFITTILAIILQVMPLGVISFLALSLLATTQTLTLAETLSGMSLPVVWMVVMAFFVARGIIKTGLGNRIAYMLIYLFGKKSLGLSYGIIIADSFLAAAIPSNTARMGGIFFPIIKSLSQSFGSTPEMGTEKKIGSFLFKTVFQVNNVTSALFITAMAANPMMVDLMKEFQLSISWGEWFLYASLPGLISIITIPLILYYLYPPELKETPNAQKWASEQIRSMGPMKQSEKVMFFVFLLLIALWIWGGMSGTLESSLVAIIGVVILLLTGVLDWSDILQEKDAWNTFVWFATLMTMATYLTKLGVIPWIGSHIEQLISGMSWPYAYVALSLFYFYIHYFFASNTAHISALFVVLLTVGSSLNVPPYLLALTLAFFSNLFGGLTQYATAPAPIIYGTGYITLKEWWKLGFIIGVWHIIVWMGLGSLWWKFWGVW